VNAPKPFEDEFRKLGFATTLGPSGRSQFTLLFVHDSVEIGKLAAPTLTGVDHDSLLWIIYPNSTSALKSNINRDTLWREVEPLGWRPVTQVAFDKDWSAMQFRPIERAGKKSG